MSYGSYSLLGNTCKSNIIACTSNHKFLPLKDLIYLKQYTYMMQYPGYSFPSSSENIISNPDHKHPIIKTYNSKTFEHSPDHNHSYIEHNPNPTKGCKTC